MMKRAILPLFFPLLALGDPGAATRYLMNDNVSMLEFGLFRMNYELKDEVLPKLISQNSDIANHEDFEVRIGGGYNWDDDLITVLITIKPATKDAEKRCKEAIESTRLNVWGGVRYGFWFTHMIFAPKSEPENLADELTERTELRCDMHKVPKGAVLVRRKLGSEDYSVTHRGQ